MGGLTPMQRLMQLRDLTDRTGILQEDQVRQLKHWPYVLDSEIQQKSATVEINIEQKLVRFRWQTSKKWLSKRDKKALFEVLCEWVETLLGPKWRPGVALEVERVGRVGKLIGTFKMGCDVDERLAES